MCSWPVPVLLTVAFCFDVVGLKNVPQVNLGIILPKKRVPLAQEPCLSVQHVRPAVDIAIQKVNSIFKEELSSGRRVQLVARYVDSRCSDIHAPLAAMELVYSGRIHAFFGPCCKYALSPVARYTNVWGLPVITPGGLVPAFSNKREFPLLTRLNAPYDKLAEFLVGVFRRSSWRTLSLLWHQNFLHPTLGTSECDQVTKALIEELRRQTDFSDPYKDIVDEVSLEVFDLGAILLEIRNHSRGRSSPSLFISGHHELLRTSDAGDS